LDGVTAGGGVVDRVGEDGFGLVQRGGSFGISGVESFNDESGDSLRLGRGRVVAHEL
jgi:hypothetical protein